MNGRGFGLLELMVSMTLMMLISGGLFLIFRSSSSTFQIGMTRQSLQSQLLRISARLSLDLRQTSFYTVSTAPASVNVDMEPGIFPFRRDSVCFAHPGGFEAATGLTLWDSYIVYVATPEVPRGRLVTYRVGASAGVTPGTLQDTWSNFTDSLVLYTTIPSFKAEGGSQRTLTRELHQFSVDRDLANQLVVMKVAIRGDRGRTMEGKRSTAEVAEVELRFRPENTWPRL